MKKWPGRDLNQNIWLRLSTLYQVRHPGEMTGYDLFTNYNNWFKLMITYPAFAWSSITCDLICWVVSDNRLYMIIKRLSKWVVSTRLIQDSSLALLERFQLKPKVLASNPGLGSFSLSVKKTVFCSKTYL